MLLTPSIAGPPVAGKPLRRISNFLAAPSRARPGKDIDETATK